MGGLKYGDITNIGISASKMITIEFFNPDMDSDHPYETIWLKLEQAKTILKLVEILESQK